MTRLALIALLALAILTLPRQAAAQDAIGGAIFGGVVGGLLGGAVGGRGGAAVGAVLGAGTGAAIAAQGERRGNYYYYQNSCYLPQGDGNYVAVSPAYCDGAPPAPAYVRGGKPTRPTKRRAARGRRPSIPVTAPLSTATAIAAAACDAGLTSDHQRTFIPRESGGSSTPRPNRKSQTSLEYSDHPPSRVMTVSWKYE